MEHTAGSPFPAEWGDAPADAEARARWIASHCGAPVGRALPIESGIEHRGLPIPSPVELAGQRTARTFPARWGDPPWDPAERSAWIVECIRSIEQPYQRGAVRVRREAEQFRLDTLLDHRIDLALMTGRQARQRLQAIERRSAA